MTELAIKLNKHAVMPNKKEAGKYIQQRI